MEVEITKIVDDAVQLIKQSKYVVAFTGAGISVESGLPLYSQWTGFDPKTLDISFFKQKPETTWKTFKDFYYPLYLMAKPGPAHSLIKDFQDAGWVKGIITLNLDDLHQKAGSRNVHNVCGLVSRVVCLQCAKKYSADEIALDELPPYCPDCGGLLKPDIQFYGDLVPDPEYKMGMKEANRAKLMLIIGTSGSMMPAGVMPMFAKRRRHVQIIEINTQPTVYTSQITDVFIPLPAAEALNMLKQRLLKS